MDKIAHEIDFTLVPVPKSTAEEHWEPPQHVYFGKRLANGRSEKEPAYVYQEYPRMLYKPVEGRLRARVANTAEECAALIAEGYGKTISEFGVVTCPSAEEMHARKIEKEATEPELVTETVEVVKRRPGRPPKAH